MKSKSAQLEAGKDYFVLSTVYDAETNSAGIKLYDVENKKGIYVTDTYGHEPYCYSRNSLQKIQAIEFPPETVKRVDSIRKRDLLNEIDDDITRIVTHTPNDVPKVRDIVGETWESRIKYHQNWIYDVQIVPGRRYWWNPDQKRFIQSRSMSSGMDIPKNIIEHLNGGLIEVFQDDFTQEIPKIPIVACDIETEYTKGQIPQATDPKFRIICICFADNQDNEIALVLERKGIEKGDKPEELSPNVQVERFTDEQSLLKRAFEVLKEYPIVATFNGDNFDFPYLHERAKHLKLGSFSPIKWDRRNKVCNFPKLGVHLDLYRFYHNVAIRSYAFGNRYQREDLDTIAQSLLGIGKIPLTKEISDLTEWELTSYCARDAKITLNLLLFDDQTPLNLIFILSRISRMPIDDLVRTSVSNWVRSLFYYEHRRRGYLIPNQKDLRVKGTQASSEAVIKGKKYKGARVIDPVPGVHFDVAVMDFASLYPSIIGTFNLSYETINCSHKDCKDNTVPQTNYWVCQKRRGIMADIIGFIKDVRVLWLKPESKKETPHKNYLQILERSLKVLINASYGVIGSDRFPLYCLPVADSTTAYGRDAIEKTIQKAQSLNVQVLYGDSVTGDTPLLLRKDSNITIRTINNLAQTWIEENGKESATIDFEIWTEQGYTKINRIIRHKTKKKIYRIVTHTGLVDVTEDHSLLNLNAIKIKPSELEIGTKLLHAFPEKFPENCKVDICEDEAFVFGLFFADGSAGKYYYPKQSYKYAWTISNKNKELLIKVRKILNRIEVKNGLKFKIIDTIKSSAVYKLIPTGGVKPVAEKYRSLFYDKKKYKIVPDIILNAPRKFKQAFFEGYYSGDGYRKGRDKFGNTRLSNKGKIGTMGLFYVLKSLGYKVSIDSRIDKMDIYRLIGTKSYQRKNSNAVKKLILMGEREDFVYDLETENNHFHAGVGQMIVHNTDSVFLHKPTKKHIDEIIEWSQKDLGVRLEMEKFYRYVVLSERKKNYFGVYPDSSVDVKGLMGKKRNTPSFLQEGFKQVLTILSNVHSNEEFDKAKNDVKELVRGIYQKLEQNFYSEEDLAVTMQLTQPLNRYKVKAQHVKAANQLEESFQEQYKIEHDGKRRRSPFIKAGKLIRFVKTRTGDRVTPVELMTEKSKVDVKAYKSMADSIFDQVFGALDIDVEEISTGQVNLMEFFG